MDKQYRKLGKNTFWMTIGNFASKILIFLLIPFYTNYLSVEEYGIADMITTTVNLVMPFFSLLMSEAILRFTLDEKNDVKQIFSISFYVTIIGFILLVIIFPMLNFNTQIKQYEGLFLLYYISVVMNNILQQFTKGLGHIKVYIFSGILNTAVTILLNLIFLLLLRWKIEGYLLAIVLGYGFTCVYIVVCERAWKYLIRINNIEWNILKTVLIYSVPLVPNSISWWISNSSDKYLLLFFVGTSVLGIYSISYKIPSLMSVVSSIFTSALQLSAVDDFGTESSSKFLSDVYVKFSQLYIIMASFLILLIREIADIMFSKSFYNAWMYSTVLVIASMFQAMCGFLGTIYTTAKKTKMIFITTIMGAFFNVILNFLLIPIWGAYGAAIATLLSYFIIWGIRLYDSQRIVKLNIHIYKDLFSYLILVVQCVIQCSDIKGAIIINFFCFAVIILLNKELLSFFISFIRIMVEKGRYNESK